MKDMNSLNKSVSALVKQQGEYNNDANNSELALAIGYISIILYGRYSQ